jgi:hypothetical protein
LSPWPDPHSRPTRAVGGPRQMSSRVRQSRLIVGAGTGPPTMAAEAHASAWIAVRSHRHHRCALLVSGQRESACTKQRGSNIAGRYGGVQSICADQPIAHPRILLCVNSHNSNRHETINVELADITRVPLTMTRTTPQTPGGQRAKHPAFQHSEQRRSRAGAVPLQQNRG